MSYIVSWWEQFTTQSVKRRPWWNLWGRDSLLTITTWRLKCITTPSKPDFETVEYVVGGLGNVWGLQINASDTASRYISQFTPPAEGEVER